MIRIQLEALSVVVVVMEAVGSQTMMMKWIKNENKRNPLINHWKLIQFSN